MIKYIVFLLIIAGLAACGEEDAYPLKTRFVIVNAAPAAPGLNIFTDNKQLDMAALTYPNHTVIDITSGKRDVKIGATLNQLFFDSTLYLVENRNYSLYFIPESDTVKAILRRDTLTLPASNKVKIRFIHLSPDVAAVNFALFDEKDTSFFNNQPYKNFPAFTEIDAGKYNIGFSLDNNENISSLVDTLITGKIYTVYLHGLSTSPAGSPQSLGVSVIQNN